MTRQKSHALLVGIVLAFLMACGDSDDEESAPDPVCEPGSVQMCACPDNAQSTQTCAEDGLSWGSCQCPEVDPNMERDIARCEAVCHEVTGCTEFVDACTQPVADNALAACLDACDDDTDARRFFLSLAGFACADVRDKVIEAFQLTETCVVIE